MRDPQFVENPCLLLCRHKAVIASDCFGTSCMNFRKRPNGSNQPKRVICGKNDNDSIRPTADTYRATKYWFGPPSGHRNQQHLHIAILRVSFVWTSQS